VTLEEIMYAQAQGQQCTLDLAPASVSAPAEEKLAKLSKLGAQQLALETRIKKGEDLLKQLNLELHELRTRTIPTAMTAAGMKSFGMLDGSEVVIERQYFASIPSEDAINKASSDDERQEMLARRLAAFGWLRGSGNEDIIKNVVKTSFGKGEDALAAALADYCFSRKLDFTQQEGVHASTLKAFVKEQYEKGRMTSEGIAALGAFDLNVSKIKPRKKDKA
jgi:hypothetical protein